MSRYSGPDYEFEESVGLAISGIVGVAVFAFLLAIICAYFFGCATSPRSDSGKDGEIGAPSASPEEWEAGALLAAETLGCEHIIWQIHGETFQQAAAVYAHDYVPGDCLILSPRHGGPNYYLGYAGQFGGCICAADPRDWTGVPVYYLSDDLHAVRL